MLRNTYFAQNYAGIICQGLLITQLINRTVNGTKLPQVSATIELELRDCDVSLNYQRTFNTHVYETSSMNTTGARRNLNNYQQVRRVSPDVITGAIE